jgi:predicted AlkP superfamily pyrophosphatase or phosphodiesterase
MITGVRPEQHGILNNRRPRSEGGEYYWDVSLLKARTLWHATRDGGLKSAAITWPVTVDAAIDYKLPEYFKRRNGGAMDLETIATKATPGLVDKIAARFPSFRQQWMDDRTRTQAAVYILSELKPDLLLLHYVDHDSEAHERGPFSPEALAILEYTDELIGKLIAAVPKDSVVALVSDHGFERIDSIVEVPGRSVDGVVLASDQAAAARLRALPGIGREVPGDELLRFAPSLKDFVTAFEPKEHVMFGDPAQPHGRGAHGLWPGRPGYRSTFLLWGKGIRAGTAPEKDMLDIAGEFARILGVSLKN